MLKSQSIAANRRTKRRAQHVRNRIRRESDRLRLSVHRTDKHFSAQVIDDKQGRTLCAVTSTAKTMGDSLAGKTKLECAAIMGAELARLAKDAGVEVVIFDRGSFTYHGRIKAFAEAAREGGLKF
ncbi:MAG: 50S ribosomal protein L18 [Planctomycetes bacterium]|jgi:large subunit ribosomal protein L18|nr:50S ribosomal protein L18 [Planctomycetota bacterium]